VQCLWSSFRGTDERDVDGSVGIGGPCRILDQLHIVQMDAHSIKGSLLPEMKAETYLCLRPTS
jgi:hypothetical protein